MKPRVLLVILASSAVTFTVPASLAGAGIEPVGAYAKLTGPKDNIDGYRALLWRDGNRLFGEFTVWQAGEEQTGSFKDGTIDDKGKSVFTVPIESPDNPSAKPLLIAIEAQISASRLDGMLWWQAERERHAEDSAAEKIRLPADKSIKLLPFKNITAWSDAAKRTE